MAAANGTIAALTGLGRGASLAGWIVQSGGYQERQLRLRAATMGEADQIRDEGSVGSIAAPMRSLTRQFEKRLDVTR